MTNLFKITLIYTLFAAFGQVTYAQNFVLQAPYFEKDGKKLQLPSLGGLNSPQFTNIDLDLDGRLDILILEKNTGKIVPVIRKPDHFEVDYSIQNNLPPISDWIICRDYNLDGKMDIFTSTPGGISLYKNTSNNSSLQFELVTDLLSSLRIYENQSFTANIFVTFSDIPFIDDLDNDGDLDILTFALGGNTIEHHKNLSIEKTGKADMDFQLVNSCYGYVTDDFSGSAFDLGISDCPDNVTNPEKSGKHSGFTFNFKSGSPKSLLVGELNSSQLVELQIGTSTFGGDSAVSQNKSFPEQAPNNLFFVGSYTGFFDLDEQPDLILSSNIRGSSNQNSVWLYDANAVLKKNNFLQDETIDVGEHASATTLDWDKDGDKDLLISSASREDFLLPQISFWENIGSPTLPQFRFIKTYTGAFTLAPPLNISTHTANQSNTILFGNSEGLIWETDFTDLFNNGFEANQAILKDENGNNILGSANSAPLKFEHQGEEVLLVANGNGRIKQYTKNNNAYTLETDFYKSIDLKGSRLKQELTLSVNNNNLWVFTQNGQAFSFDLAQEQPPGTLQLDYLKMVGERSTGHLTDINNDLQPDILIGTDDGGLLVFSTSTISNIEKANKKVFSLYPNPFKNEIRLQNLKQPVKYCIYNSIGAMMQAGTSQKTINAATLAPGAYYLVLSTADHVEFHSLWKE